MMKDQLSDSQPYEAQAQWLKVLTHPARLAILNILRDGEHCVCHMEAHLGYRQAYISQQLMVLREAGIDPGPAGRLECFLPGDRTPHF